MFQRLAEICLNEVHNAVYFGPTRYVGEEDY